MIKSTDIPKNRLVHILKIGGTLNKRGRVRGGEEGSGQDEEGKKEGTREGAKSGRESTMAKGEEAKEVKGLGTNGLKKAGSVETDLGQKVVNEEEEG